jgi:transcriptional regulator with XRE-family HTH domain
MNQSELIGYKLKQHRMKLGWTQEQMADKLNVRQNTVSGYEKDGVHDIDTIMEINHRLGINLLSENKEEQSFNNIILKKICNYYMDNSDTMYPFANILTKTFLQGNLLHGYGKDTASLDGNLRSMECTGLIRLCSNEMNKEDHTIYILMTAKGILSLGADDFPDKWVFEHLSNTALQEIINPKLKERNIEMDRKREKMREEAKKEALELEKLKAEYQDKVHSVDEKLNHKNIAVLTEYDITGIIEAFTKYGISKELDKCFLFIRYTLPNKNSTVDLLEKTLTEFKKLPKNFDGASTLINDVYRKCLHLFYNLLFESYQRSYFEEQFYERIHCMTNKLWWYEFQGPLQNYDENDIEGFVKSLLPEKMDYHCYFAASTLLRALITYLLENESLPTEYKNIVNVKKLIYAAEVDENDTCEHSPLDKLFLQAEKRNANCRCVDIYKQFKFLDYKERKLALAISLDACTKYLNKSISLTDSKMANRLKKIEQINHQLDSEIRKYEVLPIIRLEDKWALYCHIFSKTLKEAYEDLGRYRDVIKHLKSQEKERHLNETPGIYEYIGPIKSIGDIFAENGIQSVKDAVNHVVLRKGNTQINEVVEDEGFFDYTIN